MQKNGSSNRTTVHPSNLGIRDRDLVGLCASCHRGLMEERVASTVGFDNCVVGLKELTPCSYVCIFPSESGSTTSSGRSPSSILSPEICVSSSRIVAETL